MDPLVNLKFNLLEEKHPFFSDDELQILLDSCNGDVRAATHKGALMKSSNESISLPGGLKTADNSKFWKNLARKYRPSMTGTTKRNDR